MIGGDVAVVKHPFVKVYVEDKVYYLRQNLLPQFLQPDACRDLYANVIIDKKTNSVVKNVWFDLEQVFDAHFGTP